MKNKISEYLKNKNIESSENIDELVNVYFGSFVSESIQYWYNRCCDFIDNREAPEPFVRPDSETAKTDKMYRTMFSQIDNTSKEQLKIFFKESMEGVLFSVFNKMDETSIGEWNIVLKSIDGKQKGVVKNNTELHEDLYNWLNVLNQNGR